MKNKPMLWVKLHTKIAADPTWRGSSLAARGLFATLLAMAGSAGEGGRIRGSDVELAGAVGITPAAFRRHFDNLPATVRRQGDYIVIANWPDFQGNGVDRVEKSREESVEKTLLELPEDLEWWSDQVARHPGLDLESELERAQAWLDGKGGTTANPKLRFLNWLTNQEKWQKERDGDIVRLPNLDLGEKAIVG